jgi:hypothetical protein
MNSAEEVALMLNALPDDTSLVAIRYHSYILEKIERGVDRAETEVNISHEDAKARLGKWLTA